MNQRLQSFRQNALPKSPLVCCSKDYQHRPTPTQNQLWDPQLYCQSKQVVYTSLSKKLTRYLGLQQCLKWKIPRCSNNPFSRLTYAIRTSFSVFGSHCQLRGLDSAYSEHFLYPIKRLLSLTKAKIDT